VAGVLGGCVGGCCAGGVVGVGGLGVKLLNKIQNVNKMACRVWDVRGCLCWEQKKERPSREKAQKKKKKTE